jgi:hypothetical protein
MKSTASLLKNPLLREISAKASKKKYQFNEISTTIKDNIPQQFSSCFNIINYENNVLIIEVNSIWLTWIKGQELQLLKILKNKYGIERIKWRNNPDTFKRIIKPKNEVRISNKSAKLVSDVAQSIKSDRLRNALLKLATRSKQ